MLTEFLCHFAAVAGRAVCKTISIRPNFGKRRALRLAGSSIVVIVMLKTQPNKILESMVITIVVQMRNLPFAYFVPVIQEDT